MNERNLLLKVRQNEYAVKFPTAGQFYDIEILKQQISHGQYNNLIQTDTIVSLDAVNMINMKAYITALCPEILKDLRCKDFDDLHIDDLHELYDVYEKELLPWIESWIDKFSFTRKKINEAKKLSEEKLKQDMENNK